MTIDEIYKKGELSVRSRNVCANNKLLSVSDIIRYYNQYKSFITLRNCGAKSNIELVRLCEKYKTLKPEENEIKKNGQLLNLKLTRIQREVINSYIRINTNNLTARSKNAITIFLKNNLNVKNFIDKIYLNDDFNIINLENVGTKSKAEIEVYISIIKDYILEVSQIKHEKQLLTLKNKFLIQCTFDISNVSSKILESESIFRLTDFLLNKNILYKKKYTELIKKSFKLYCNQENLTLDEIALENNYTRERIRQIRKLCIEVLFDKLEFIKNFNDNLFQNYSIDTDSSHILISQDVVYTINNSSNTHFSKEFISYILYVYLHDRFSLIGNYEDVLFLNQSKARTRHNWINLYIVEKKLASEFDFTSFTNDISNRLSDRIEESYFFNFKSYLSNFLTNYNIDVLDLLFPICEKIINEEFEIYLDLDENLIFKRNTKKTIDEFVFEALESLGTQSHIDTIYEKVTQMFPEKEFKIRSVRSSMNRSNCFIPIGRKSVFGLLKWENEKEDFKGGTIRSLTRDYLMQFKTPKHLYEIFKFITEYRPNTYPRSILDNLKAETSHEFIFFKQHFIGLSMLSSKYETTKYDRLPNQLGKKILKMESEGKNYDEIQQYLIRKYSLKKIEVVNIIELLKQKI